MNRILASALALFVAAPVLADPGPRGIYVEARTADVWTGPCFANAEEGVAGKEATVAWVVEEGAWNGVDLSGLAVVAVVRAEGTLGDVHANPVPSRSILLVDERADAAQRRALVEFARQAGVDALGEVTGVAPAPMRFAGDAAARRVELAAGEQVRLATRPLTHADHVCGNEFVYYPPLVEGVRAEPAATTENAYSGDAFAATWASPGKRSAFVGRFGG